MVKKNPKKAVTKSAVKKNATKKTVVKKTAATNKASLAVKKSSAKKISKTIKRVSKRASKKTKNDEECFLTTACVHYYALPDDSCELTTLRTFRDQYMLKSNEGKALVKQYYAIAPFIVSMIQKDKEHQSVYQYIYTTIQKACSEIAQQKYAVAQQTYVSLVNRLSKKYRIKA